MTIRGAKRLENLVNIEVIKVRLRIKMCEKIGIFRHEELDETLKNLLEIRILVELGL